MARRRNRTVKKGSPVESKRSPLKENESHIVTLFADIVGCSEISNHMPLLKYNEFLNDFQACFKEVCAHYMKREYEEHEHPFFKYSVRGDEGCLMIFVPVGDEIMARHIDIAINIALDLKRKWLFNEHNRERIKGIGLLPVDLAIGIHSGKVYLNKEGDDYRPEGYAINLAKRIESEARNGKFTHILVSEATRGQLYNLKDEATYNFDKPFTIRPKGISRDIKVFEIKHHFLATDWTDLPSEVSIIYDQIDDDKVKIAKLAYEDNPTNIWLAEEYILLILMNGYHKLSEKGKADDVAALSAEYAPAIEVVTQIANSELRDSGLLSIWGFIVGELKKYEEEQKRYNEAIEIDEQNGDIFWYLAYSMSAQLNDDYDEKKDTIQLKQFYENNRENIENIIKKYERAQELRPMNPWIVYDLACELSWWSQVESSWRRKSIAFLNMAIGLNSKIKERAEEEPYLKPIITDPDVKKYLS